ncbi:glycosyltransferase [Neobacillus sp. PS2-9]|uniref:glycosyltransferase n=1 Tax=Neobacillus sp. PS2-9 TaxID=3070676 RepID=UPI0027E0E4AD|nr:glycosyltransferase [Neobacillus sp. PS2-9]WML58588.1 glycosyltransferase [Neobacillus sp. PS2-9]
MKILYVITGADIGGAQRHLLYLSEWFLKKGHDIQVVVGEEGPFIEALTDLGIQVRVIPIPRTISVTADSKALRTLIAFIKKEKFDIVHSHSSIAGILTRVAGYVNRVDKNIFTAHGFVFTDPTLSKKKKWMYLFLEKVCSWLSTDIITVSKFDFFKGKEVGIKEQKMHVIPNGIPNKDILSRDEWRAKQVRLMQSEKRIIGFVGRFASEKNIDMLLRVATLFKENNIANVEFWVIGDGPLFDHYQAEVSRQKLQSIIQLKGNQVQVVEWMDQMHVMVITSHKEGLPYVLLEACGRGLPVVSTDVGGIKEVIDPDGTQNLLVQVNDDQAMYDRLDLLLSDDSYREKLGMYFLEVSCHYSVHEMCVRTEKIYLG